MIKQTFFFLTFCFFTKAFSCDCEFQKFHESYIQSDFIAKIKILKIYKNIDNSDLYKADILIEDLYKGEKINSIYIYGNNGRKLETSCDIRLLENEELIIYSKKNKKGQYVVGMCSRTLYLERITNNEIQIERHQKEIKILKELKSKKVNFTHQIKYRLPINERLQSLMNHLNQNEKIRSDNDFAIYELTFNDSLKVKCVRKVQRLGNNLDSKIKKYLKSKTWSNTYKGKSNVNKNNDKYLVIVYYHKTEKGNYLSVN